MNSFLERLPWRVAALAGLVVGAGSLFGGTDVWVTLARVGICFVLFWLLGRALAALLSAPPEGDANKGKRVDFSTPDMAIRDVVDGEAQPGAAGGQGDESEQ